jgi:hypothetical protein
MMAGNNPASKNPSRTRSPKSWVQLVTNPKDIKTTPQKKQIPPRNHLGPIMRERMVPGNSKMMYGTKKRRAT